MSKRVRAAWAAVLWVGVAGLSGCAVGGGAASQAAGTPGAAPRIAMPPASIGQWYDLGAYRAPWLAGDGVAPVSGPNVPTRVAGWKRETGPQDPAKTQAGHDGHDEWLAIVIVQTAPGASVPCSAQPTSLDLADSGGGCLRLRRNADFDHWMQAVQPALYRWVDEHGWTSLPRAWAAYRSPSAGDGAIEVHVLFAPSLIEPTTRNTTDFLSSGLPGQKWARQLAAAVRAQGGAANAVLALPPFPFAPSPRAEQELTLSEVPLSKTGAAAPAPAPAPATAEQVIPAAMPEPPPTASNPR